MVTAIINWANRFRQFKKKYYEPVIVVIPCNPQVRENVPWFMQLDTAPKLPQAFIGQRTMAY